MDWNTIDNSLTFDTDSSPITVELKEGQSLGKNKNYRLEKNLGVGGMGEVWLASEILGGMEIRKVVVKTLRPDRRDNEGAQEKALKQFQLIQTLNHTNICPIYVIENDPACGYLIVMGYANGESYANWFAHQQKQNGGLPLKTVCNVLRPIADALDYAHMNGVIHRDVKPENMMFTLSPNGNQTSWLIDFGIAANLRSETQATTGQFSQSGTVSYMAPEQHTGQLQTAQTDEYALALVALEFLTGTTFLQALQVLKLEIQRVLNKALALKPSNRYTTCRAFIDALERSVSSGPSKSAPTPNDTEKATPASKSSIEQIVGTARLAEEAKRRAEKEALTIQIKALDKWVAEEYQTGHYTEAIVHLNELLKLKPNHPNAQWLLKKCKEKLAIQQKMAAERKAREEAERLERERKAREKAVPLVLLDDDVPERIPALENIMRQANDTRARKKTVQKEKRKPRESFWQKCESFLSIFNAPVFQILGFILFFVVRPLLFDHQVPRKVLEADGIEYVFRWCPPGEFTMGSTNGNRNEIPAHEVQLAEGFWLLETEVTQEMWESVMGENPSYFKGARKPVERVSWNDCQLFCQRLSEKLGQQIQLPSEEQWEYACRAGKKDDQAGNLDSMEWYGENSGNTTHEVGQKKPNAWKLYDMCGNVCEWCSDYIDENSYLIDPTSDPEQWEGVSIRAMRGGAWCSHAELCTPASRIECDANFRSDPLGGFRILLVSQ